MQTVATRIAQDFSARLQAELGPQVITEINRRNAIAAFQSGACATHEYCDANVSMIVVGGAEPAPRYPDHAGGVGGARAAPGHQSTPPR